MTYKYLFFGAHPDDADEMMGGTAIKLISAGHVVKFVSVCNGDCGHYAMDNEELAKRRFQEAQRSARIAGISEYQILDNHDCRLLPSQDNRDEIIRIIRRFQPDMVISHRNCDYHADHRTTAQLIMDAAYLLKVPLYCRDTPIPERNPVFAYSYDPFTEPRRFRPDAAVEIDSVLEVKLRMLDCHVSQYYEWLPWDNGMKDCDIDLGSWESRKAWLYKTVIKEMQKNVSYTRKTLVEEYGKGKGGQVNNVEVFELSEYGRQISINDFRSLLGISKSM